MRADRLHVPLQQLCPPGRLLPESGHGDRGCLEVRVERHLRIDGERLAPGKAHDHVGAPLAGVRGDRRLQVEVDVTRQPGRLDDPPQLRLAPDPARRIRAEGSGERLRRRAQRLIRRLRLAQLFREGAELGLAVAFEGGHLLLHRLQRLLDGGERAEHELLASFPLLLRALVGARLRAELTGERPLLLELLAERACRRVGGAQARGERRSIAGGTFGGAGAAGEPAGDQAADQAEDREGDDDECIHVHSVPEASDIVVRRTVRRSEPPRWGAMPCPRAAARAHRAASRARRRRAPPRGPRRRS